MISKITITTSGNFDFLMSICGNWNLRRLRRSSSVRHRWLQFPAMRDRHRKEGSYSYWLSTHVGSISHVLCFQIPDYQVWFGYSAYLLTYSIQLIWWWIFFHNIQYSSLLPWYSHDNPMICCENIQKYSHHFPYIPIISYKFPSLIAVFSSLFPSGARWSDGRCSTAPRRRTTPRRQRMRRRPGGPMLATITQGENIHKGWWRHEGGVLNGSKWVKSRFLRFSMERIYAFLYGNPCVDP